MFAKIIKALSPSPITKDSLFNKNSKLRLGHPVVTPLSLTDLADLLQKEEFKKAPLTNARKLGIVNKNNQVVSTTDALPDGIKLFVVEWLGKREPKDAIIDKKLVISGIGGTLNCGNGDLIGTYDRIIQSGNRSIGHWLSLVYVGHDPRTTAKPNLDSLTTSKSA